MKTKSSSDIALSLKDTWLALCSLIKTLYRGMPLLMIVFTVIVAYFTYLTKISLPWMIFVLSFIIVVSSIAIYVKSANYGEAVLSLAAGLFTVYTVEWELPLFIGFLVVWVLFTIIVMLITSVRLASKLESIMIDCVNVLKLSDDDTLIKKKLESISGSVQNSLLGPVERAEVLRLFCFRQIDMSYMSSGLKWVNIYYTITKIAYIDLATFVSDVIRNTELLKFKTTMDEVFDYIYKAMRSAPVSPQEYMQAFAKSRYILSANKNTILFFKSLSDYFNANLPEAELENFLISKLSVDSESN